MSRHVPQRTALRLITGAIGATALLIGSAAAAAAEPLPSSGSGSSAPPPAAPPAPPGPLVTLLSYCQNTGNVAHVANGRTVHCVLIDRTDAHVWSYSRHSMVSDPNKRPYTCDHDRCRMPDGTDAPGYTRCGILCDEPPTSGDIQSGFYDCFNSGAPYEECERRIS